MKSNLVLFKVRYAGVCVYGDIIGRKDLGMDCSAFTISFIGVLDDVYFYRKLSPTQKTTIETSFLRN